MTSASRGGRARATTTGSASTPRGWRSTSGGARSSSPAPRTCSSATGISTTRWGCPTCSPSARSTGWSIPGCSARPRSQRTLGAFIAAAERLERARYRYDLVPLSPGDRVPVGKGLTMEAFATDHVVPSLGYHLWRGRRRLAPAFAGLPAAELIRLREEGVETARGGRGHLAHLLRRHRAEDLRDGAADLPQQGADAGVHLPGRGAPGQGGAVQASLPGGHRSARRRSSRTRPSSCITCHAGSESRNCGPKSSGACRSWRPGFISSWRERRHERTTERRRAGRRRTRPGAGAPSDRPPGRPPGGGGTRERTGGGGSRAPWQRQGAPGDPDRRGPEEDRRPPGSAAAGPPPRRAMTAVRRARPIRGGAGTIASLRSASRPGRPPAAFSEP